MALILLLNVAEKREKVADSGFALAYFFARRFAKPVAAISAQAGKIRSLERMGVIVVIS